MKRDKTDKLNMFEIIITVVTVIFIAFVVGIFVYPIVNKDKGIQIEDIIICQNDEKLGSLAEVDSLTFSVAQLIHLELKHNKQNSGKYAVNVYVRQYKGLSIMQDKKKEFSKQAERMKIWSNQAGLYYLEIKLKVRRLGFWGDCKEPRLRETKSFWVRVEE